MSQIPTLFQLTGSEYPAAQWQDAVLVIIDAQNEYHSGDMKLPDIEAATVQIWQLLAAARAQGTPVAHIRHIGVPGYLFDPEGPRGQILDELTPVDGEAVRFPVASISCSSRGAPRIPSVLADPRLG